MPDDMEEFRRAVAKMDEQITAINARWEFAMQRFEQCMGKLQALQMRIDRFQAQSKAGYEARSDLQDRRRDTSNVTVRGSDGAIAKEAVTSGSLTSGQSVLTLGRVNCDVDDLRRLADAWIF